jgi:hypothetical protein
MWQLTAVSHVKVRSDSKVCIASINALVDKIDLLLATNNTSAVQHLKEIFGLEELSDIRDFAATIAFPST